MADETTTTMPKELPPVPEMTEEEKLANKRLLYELMRLDRPYTPKGVAAAVLESHKYKNGSPGWTTFSRFDEGDLTKRHEYLKRWKKDKKTGKCEAIYTEREPIMDIMFDDERRLQGYISLMEANTPRFLKTQEHMFAEPEWKATTYSGKNVRAVVGLVIDLDLHIYLNAAEMRLQMLENMQALLQLWREGAIDFPMPAIEDSGRGIHLWWIFSKAVPYAKGTKSDIWYRNLAEAAVNKMLQIRAHLPHYVDVDHVVTAALHAYNLPGTINGKTETRRQVINNDWNPVSPQKFSEALGVPFDVVPERRNSKTFNDFRQGALEEQNNGKNDEETQKIWEETQKVLDDWEKRNAPRFRALEEDYEQRLREQKDGTLLQIMVRNYEEGLTLTDAELEAGTAPERTYGLDCKALNYAEFVEREMIFSDIELLGEGCLEVDGYRVVKTPDGGFYTLPNPDDFFVAEEKKEAPIEKPEEPKAQLLLAPCGLKTGEKTPLEKPETPPQVDGTAALKPKTAPKAKKKPGKATFLKNNSTDEFTANCRVQKLISWAEGRGWDLRGKRNEWLACIVSMLVSGAHQKLTVGDLQQFNQMLSEPLPEEELAAILKTMSVYPYPMKNDTIAKHLGMTDEEFLALTTPSSSGGSGEHDTSFVSRKQYLEEVAQGIRKDTRKPHKTRDATRAKNKEAKEELYKQIQERKKKGWTKIKTAVDLGVSERTVRRHWNDE